jgi:hypothetical protein
MSPAGDDDAVGALALRTGDPPLADRLGPWRLDWVVMIRMPAAVKTASNAAVYLTSL